MGGELTWRTGGLGGKSDRVGRPGEWVGIGRCLSGRATRMRIVIVSYIGRLTVDNATATAMRGRAGARQRRSGRRAGCPGGWTRRERAAREPRCRRGRGSSRRKAAARLRVTDRRFYWLAVHALCESCFTTGGHREHRIGGCYPQHHDTDDQIECIYAGLGGGRGGEVRWPQPRP